MTHHSITRPLARIITLPALLALATSCSSGGREYSLPDTLCDVPVNTAMLDPVLPDGNELWVSTDPLKWLLGEGPPGTPKESRCEVVVDMESAIWIPMASRSEPKDPTTDNFHKDVAHTPIKELNSTPERVSNLPFAGTAAISDWGVTAYLDCGLTEAPYIKFVVEVKEFANPDVAQRRTAALKIAKEIIPKVSTELGCTS